MSTATDAARDSADSMAPGPPYPPEVEAFCAAHNLRPHLDTAVRIVREVFPTLLTLTTEVEQDYESPRTWVTIQVTVPPGVLGDGKAHGAYTARKVRDIPPDPRDLIRLSAFTG